jgi:spore coat polysaccharide biosynthesis protein SpsF
MNSARLPGKVLFLLRGKPMLQFQIELLKQLLPDLPLAVATTRRPEDDKIETLCQELSIHVYRGSESNVFGRLLEAAKVQQWNTLIRLTGDNPLPNKRILQETISAHQAVRPELTSTRWRLPDGTWLRGVPMGQSVDIISVDGMEQRKACLDAEDKEHVIPIFFKTSARVVFVATDTSRSSQRFSVDTMEDFKKMEELIEALVRDGELCSFLNAEELRLMDAFG